MKSHFQKSIVDSIIKYKYASLLNIHDYEEKANAHRIFTDEILNLIKSDKQVFDEAILSVLNDECEYLNQEDTQIKMECAGIYGKRHFRSKVYRICYDYDIAIVEVALLLKRELIELYNSNDIYTNLDIMYYSDLILDILNEEKYSKISKDALRDVVKREDVKTFVDFQIFVALNRDDSSVSKYRCLIPGIKQVSALQNTGLLCWLQENDLSSIRKTVRLITKYGFSSLKTILNDFIKLITPIKNNQRTITNDDCDEIDRIDKVVLCTIGIHAVDVISANIIRSLQ